ncbi:hypothetical protein CSKR_201226 [Clonorchis sinensis]|uniref:Uncharacterized protein n=1 Tax=Clonorchis sinensis TaxID=79923 RepID=A0A8T1MNG7_CLOSI|nr:hypothetical protein CSKR_201226 [Clonorchis sinensis]
MAYLFYLSGVAETTQDFNRRDKIMKNPGEARLTARLKTKILGKNIVNHHATSLITSRSDSLKWCFICYAL